MVDGRSASDRAPPGASPVGTREARPRARPQRPRSGPLPIEHLPDPGPLRAPPKVETSYSSPVTAGPLRTALRSSLSSSIISSAGVRRFQIAGLDRCTPRIGTEDPCFSSTRPTGVKKTPQGRSENPAMSSHRTNRLLTGLIIFTPSEETFRRARATRATIKTLVRSNTPIALARSSGAAPGLIGRLRMVTMPRAGTNTPTTALTIATPLDRYVRRNPGDSIGLGVGRWPIPTRGRAPARAGAHCRGKAAPE